MTEFIYQKDTILSEKHVDLILEEFLSKRLYENNLITFDIYERIKEEIDNEISQLKSDFQNLLKDKND